MQLTHAINNIYKQISFFELINVIDDKQKWQDFLADQLAKKSRYNML